MTGVTQTVPNYFGGISNQPDYIKQPGQVKDLINAIPDLTHGLYKRPGSKRIGTSKLSAGTGGAWFHYYRDATEGSYIGRVDHTTGVPTFWKCSDGTQMTTLYDTSNGGNETNLKAYLTASDPKNLKFLTINDTTFAVNSSDTKYIETTGTTTARPHTYASFIELQKTENGRQYSLNVNSNDTETTYDTAIRLDISSYADPALEPALSTPQHAPGAPHTGHCPATGTKVFDVTDDTSTVCATSTVNTSDNDIDLGSAHGWVDGQAVRYDANGGAAITGLTDGTIYYIIKGTAADATDNNHFRLAATHAEAIDSSPTAINLQSTGNNAQAFKTGGRNLIFRVTIRGQQGSSTSMNINNDDNHTTTMDYGCTYQTEITLLHGGEDWTEGMTTDVTLEGYDYRITIEKAETTRSKANLKAVRPKPTPFDADTAVTASAILGGITSELDNITNVGYEVIGNGIYVYSNTVAFNVQVVENDLMKAITLDANDVTELPTQCKHGYIVKVDNTSSEEDDYYLKFDAENGVSGIGSWVECAKPGIALGFNLTNMPIIFQRTSATEFTVKRYTWNDRDVGDDVTNPKPSIISTSSNPKPIQRILFWRNRLVLLCDKNVIASRPGDFGNFWRNTALAVSASDPIDIACSSTFPSKLYDGIELPDGLLVFSSDQQFLLSTIDSVLTPDTARLSAVSSYNYNQNVPPISLGQTVGFIDNSGSYSRFFEMANINNQAPPDVVNQTKVVSKLIPNNLDLLTNSKENGIVLMGVSSSDIVYGYRYHSVAGRRLQTSWFKWKLTNPVKYHFVIGEVYYFIDTDNFLQQINLIQSSTDAIITQDATDFLTHIDNYTTLSGGTYNSTDDETTFSNVSWVSDVTTPNGPLVIIDDRESISHIRKSVVARYTKPKISGTTLTIDGDWTDATSADAVTSITITNSGSGYTSAPTVTITNTSGSNGSGATATAVVDTLGRVTEVNITNCGGGYDNGATIAFSGGGGSSAAATATVTAAESPVKVGYLYDYQVDFPKFYVSSTQGETVISDINASLVLHRIKLGLGQVGLYQSILNRTGKPSYTETYESAQADLYDLSEAPYLLEKTRTIPVYEKNTNINLTIKSTHPSPATIRSLSWEGDYSNKFYKRV